jgi:RNA 3'-terminal phosphate cyclase (ATP)
MIVIDGSYGEGGGQVLRTCLALAAISGQAVRIERIRAGRHKPGLKPQHLTAVRAAAKICDAVVEGDKPDSQTLSFVPHSAPRAGTYTFDVSLAAKGGSAGAVSLIFQTVLPPLALAEGTSHLTLAGGTHVAWSPPFDYLKRVYLPTLARMGIRAKVNLEKWGWYPSGGGIVKATVEGRAGSQGLCGLDLMQRGKLQRVRGLSASSNLPKHIRERQAGTVLQVLRSAGLNPRVDEIDAPSKGQGTAVFLWAECDNALAGFTALGERGKPAEQVAEEAARALLAYVNSQAALDRYLVDQLVLPLALASGPSHLATETVTQHLLTVAWAVCQFLPGRVRVEGTEGQQGVCHISEGEAS